MAHVQFDSSINIFNENHRDFFKFCRELMNEMELLSIRGLSGKITRTDYPGFIYSSSSAEFEFAWNGRVFARFSHILELDTSSYVYLIDITNKSNALGSLSDICSWKKQVLNLLLAHLKDSVEMDIIRNEQINARITQARQERQVSL